MENGIARAEHEEFAKRIDAENTRQNRRIEALEQSVDRFGRIASSVERLATNMEGMLREQERQGERLDKLEAGVRELVPEDGVLLAPTEVELREGESVFDLLQRACREAAGRLSCLLARRADRVVRVFCGLPLVLKETGESKTV